MANTVRIYVEEIAERLEVFSEIELYRGSSADADFTTLVDTADLAEDTYAYEIEDDDGGPDDWYVYRFDNPSTLVSSDYSPPFQVRGGTLAAIRLQTAEAAGCGFAGRTTSAGTATTLVDAELRDQGLDERFLEGAWVVRPGASSADRVRRLAPEPFDTSNGALTVVRDWDSSPGANERYEVYNTLPPVDQRGATYSWEAAVRDGLRYCWFTDEITVGVASGDTREFDITSHRSLTRRQIRRVVARTEVSGVGTQDTDYNRNGRFWDLRNDDGLSSELILSSTPASGAEIVVEVIRRPDTPYTSENLVDFNAEVAAAAGVLAAYRRLNRVTPTRGQYAAELAGALEEFTRLYEPYRPADNVIGR